MHDTSSPLGQLTRDGDSLRGPDFVDVDIDPSWLDFGPDDPLDAARWINPCANCSAQPSLSFNGRHHVVRCGCGAQGQPGSFPAIAALNWNKSPRSIRPPYKDLPFFSLGNLSIEDARTKLVRIREYLEEQRRRCEWRIEQRIGTGHRYHQRVRAYLLWTVYGLSLLKEQETGDVPPPAPTQDDPACLARRIVDRFRRAW